MAQATTRLRRADRRADLAPHRRGHSGRAPVRPGARPLCPRGSSEVGSTISTSKSRSCLSHSAPSSGLAGSPWAVRQASTAGRRTASRGAAARRRGQPDAAGRDDAAGLVAALPDPPAAPPPRQPPGAPRAGHAARRMRNEPTSASSPSASGSAHWYSASASAWIATGSSCSSARRPWPEMWSACVCVSSTRTDLASRARPPRGRARTA